MINELYLYPQEVWNRKKCETMAKRRPTDGIGTPGPQGLISSFSSPYPTYGVAIYRGKVTIDGKTYRREGVPLPKIPDDFEIVSYASWGWKIQKKNKVS